MKQKTILAWAALGAAGLLLTGCSNTAESETSAETTAVETTAVTTAVAETTAVTTTNLEESLKTIGIKTEDEVAFAVHLTNATDKSIIGVSVKESSQDSFPENMLSDSDAFVSEEERILYYDPSDAIEENENTGDVDESALTPEYTVQLTFEDGTTAELHQFPFTDMESGQVKLEDSVVFLVYTSLESKTEVNTKEAELMLAQEAAAEEEAAQQAAVAEEEAAQQAAAEKEAAQQAAAEEEAAQQAAAEEDANTYEAAPAETPQENNDPNDGCLGDEGLFY